MTSHCVSLLRLALISGLAIAPMPVRADLIPVLAVHISLDGVIFSDGASASGGFDYDINHISATNFNIVTTAVGSFQGATFGDGSTGFQESFHPLFYGPHWNSWVFTLVTYNQEGDTIKLVYVMDSPSAYDLIVPDVPSYLLANPDRYVTTSNNIYGSLIPSFEQSAGANFAVRFFASSASSVAEPGSIALIGVALAGLSAACRRCVRGRLRV